MNIVSKRGREIQNRQDVQRRLEEKYLIVALPLPEIDQEHIREVFEQIRRQLDSIRRIGQRKN